MPAEFAISEAAVADASPPTGPPVPPTGPGIGTFPSILFGSANVKLRFLEPNTASGVNARWLGMPRGVYLGFTPSVTSGSRTLTLNIDDDHGFSLLKVGSSQEPVMVDLFTDQPATLDFTSHTVFPIYVIATSKYNSSRTATQVKIFTRATPPVDHTEVLVCSVSITGEDLTVDFDIPSNKEDPTAFTGQVVGYMPGGSTTQLDSSLLARSEVIAARTSVYTGSHETLLERLNDDFAGEEIANKLALRQSNILSNTHTNKIGTVLNVSGSFTETNRTTQPFFTFTAGGSESAEGALTAVGRNLCFVIDSDTCERLVDQTTKEPVFGALSFSSGLVDGGGAPDRTISFTKAVNIVTGTNGPFQSPLEEGDIVLGPDSLSYEISVIVDTNNAILGSAFQGTTGSVVNTPYRRFELTLDTVAGGFAGIPSTDVQFSFPSFLGTDRAIFDGTLVIKKNGERPPLSNASQTAAGKALLAVDSGLVGALRTISENSITVANDVHTLNFTSGGATPSGSPGVIDIAVDGPIGPTGPASNVGPTGPSGQAPNGWVLSNPFESADSPTTGLPILLSHTFDFSGGTPALSTLNFVSGGFSAFYNVPPGGGQKIEITSFSKTGPTTAQIDGQIDPGSAGTIAGFGLHLGGAQ